MLDNPTGCDTQSAQKISEKPVNPLLVSMGDAAGVGAETIAAGYACAPDIMRSVIVLGDAVCLRRAVGVCGLCLVVREYDSLESALHCPPDCIPVLQVDGLSAPPPFGTVSRAAGAYSAKCVSLGADMVLRGEAVALVTAPIHKEAWAVAGIPYPGHTELLQHAAASYVGVSVADMPVRMMLAASHLRVILVTVHMSLRQALDTLTAGLVEQTIRIAHDSLSAMLGRAPHLAVAALNPHAGEGGLFGCEEAEIIQPAVDASRADGINVTDPQSPDTVFMRASSANSKKAEYDAVIAMYHDQGLIPVKYLGTDDGVNVTLGLPLVRTSPDHGTAFDIAGKGKARPHSLLLAIRQARLLGN